MKTIRIIFEKRGGSLTDKLSGSRSVDSSWIEKLSEP
jgi:hypothetical protein